MSNWTYLHNPRCSKSRQGLALLEDHKIPFETLLYLENTPSSEEIFSILELLGTDWQKGIRTKEALYKELGLKGQNLDIKEWAVILAKNPKLIERPILFNKEQAIIGRPPEDLIEKI